MWQRFTQNARGSIFYAQEEALRWGGSYVEPEHLFLGILRGEHLADYVLKELGIEKEAAAERVRKEMLPTQELSAEMTLSPKGKRVIDLAYSEAREMNDSHIGVEHLLLGLIRDGDNLAYRALSERGVELGRARAAVVHARLNHQSDGDKP